MLQTQVLMRVKIQGFGHMFIVRMGFHEVVYDRRLLSGVRSVAAFAVPSLACSGGFWACLAVSGSAI